MSMLSLGRNGSGKAVQTRTEPPPYPPAPPPVVRHAGPHQLGSTTLANLDDITSMSAEEIERTADQIEQAGRETADVLREAARRVRHSGLIANERLANTVRVFVTCADAARLMQASVENRDQPQPEPPAQRPAETQAVARVNAETGEPSLPADLDKLAEQIGMVRDEAARDGAAG